MGHPLAAQHAALTAGAGFHVFAERTQIELTGGDRAKFLHGLCTNDILSLPAGGGCEAFLTNVQGKVIGHVYVFSGHDRLVLDTVAGEAASITAGLERYLIREDVVIRDQTKDLRVFVASGAACVDRLQQHFSSTLPTKPLDHTEAELDRVPVSARRVPFCGTECYLFACPTDDLETCQTALLAAGFRECGAEALEMVRIEAGTPLFGIDVTSDNLPQEVGRDEQAISFNKGCYLGQETVARLDALGHVNRRLVGLQIAGDAVPDVGTVLKVNDKPAARITSSCWSCKLQSALALAYVRRGNFAPGTRIETELGSAQVIKLPVESHVPPT